MTERLNLGKAVLAFLKERDNEKFTARQIAEWIFATYPAECQEKKASSQADYIKTDADLVQQLVAEIGSRRPSLQKRHPELKTTEGRPRKYYYSEKSDSAEVAAAESAAVPTTADTSDANSASTLCTRYFRRICGRSSGSIRSASTRNAHRTSAGRMAIAGCTRTWSGWKTWARSGTRRCGTA